VGGLGALLAPGEIGKAIPALELPFGQADRGPVSTGGGRRPFDQLFPQVRGSVDAAAAEGEQVSVDPWRTDDPAELSRLREVEHARMGGQEGDAPALGDVGEVELTQ